jgi:hypothetical protein
VYNGLVAVVQNHDDAGGVTLSIPLQQVDEGDALAQA